jgi:hypothetical protein
MIDQAILDAGASFAFGVIVLGVVATIMLVLLFVGLAIRHVWGWLTRSDWRDVIVSVERKALRRY